MHKSLFILVTSLLLLSSTDMPAKNKEKKSHSSKCCCPPPEPPQPPAPRPLIVGSWALNEELNEVPSFSVISAHEDGTITIHRSLSIQQPAPSDFPTGNYTTIEEGVWRARSSNVFQVMSTSVVNLITTGIPAALAGTPLARAQSTLTITISADGKTIDISGLMALFEITDVSFTRALLNPTTGLPFVTNIAATGKRVTFSPLDTGP